MSSPQGPLQGGVVYTDKGSLFSRILHGVAGVLKDVGGAVIDHAPEILQGVATGLAATSLNPSRNIMPNYSSNLNLSSLQSGSHRISTPNISAYQPVEDPQTKPLTIARDTLQRLESQRQRYPVEIPEYTQHNPLSGLVRQNTGQIAPPQYRPQLPDMEIYNDYQHSNGVFLQSLDPNFGHDASAPLQEDSMQVQHNLAHAQKHVTRAELNMFRQQQELARQQAELQQLAQQQHRLVNTRPLNESPALHQMIMRANKERDANRPKGPDYLPSAWMQEGTNITQKVVEGHVPKDNELKQLFHALDIQKFSAKTDAAMKNAQYAEIWLKSRLVDNMTIGPDALINRDDYVIIGDQAYGTFEARAMALADINHFQETDKHLKPLPYPTRPDLPKSAYPDVTKKVNQNIAAAVKEIKEKRIATQDFFSKNIYVLNNFNNNKKYDMQVGHGLPGQVIVTKNGKAIHDPEVPTRVLTTDQYAIFNGKIQRAGYISNYVFGYAAREIGLPKIWIQGSAHAASAGGSLLRGGFKFDSKGDQDAMVKGWEANDKTKY